MKRRNSYTTETALLCLGMGVLGAIVSWASLVETNVGVQTEGKVVAASLNKRIQHAEGGTVREILVKEGQVVNANDVIVRLDRVAAEAEVGQQAALLASLRAKAARLSALAEGAGVSFLEGTPEHVRSTEQAMFQETRRLVDAQVAGIEMEAAKSKATIEALEAQLAGAKAQAATLREIVAQQEAASKSTGSRTPLAEAQARLQAVQTQVAALPAQITAEQRAVELAGKRIEEVRAKATAQARGDQAQTIAEIGRVEQSLRASEHKLAMTDVRSPVRGVVQRLLVTAPGETVGGGAQGLIAEIVPLGDGVIVEARVPPEKMEGLKEGLPARVSLTAYSVSKYGSVEGRVVQLSPDAETDARSGAAAYVARIRVDATEIAGEPIKPGLRANVAINQEITRHPIAYLFAPVTSLREQAFTER